MKFFKKKEAKEEVKLTFAQKVRSFVIRYGIAAIVGVCITVYAYEPVGNFTKKVAEVFKPHEYVASASTTEPVVIDEFDADVKRKEQSKEGQDMLHAWAVQETAAEYKTRMAEIEAEAARKVSSFE